MTSEATDGLQHRSTPDNRVYLRNAYRVLLTRARQGMVVFVPPGDTADPTRSPGFYDSTFNYLSDLGIPTIAEPSSKACSRRRLSFPETRVMLRSWQGKPASGLSSGFGPVQRARIGTLPGQPVLDRLSWRAWTVTPPESSIRKARSVENQPGRRLKLRQRLEQAGHTCLHCQSVNAPIWPASATTAAGYMINLGYQHRGTSGVPPAGHRRRMQNVAEAEVVAAAEVPQLKRFTPSAEGGLPVPSARAVVANR